jgi:signal transduction histidine kinase
VRPVVGIRARLAIALIVVVAGALAGAYLMVVPSLERRLVEAKLDQLQTNAEQLATILATRAFVDDLDVQVASASAIYSSGVAVFNVYGTPPALFTASYAATPGPETLARDTVALGAARSAAVTRGRVVRGGRQYAEVAVPIYNGPPIVRFGEDRSGLGTADLLLFTDSLGDQLATVKLIERRLVYAAAVAIAIAIALGSVAAALHARRIRRIERAAHRIAAGTFDEPLEDAGRDEVGELARAFDRMRVRLGSLDTARREFVANASHELRTPLFSLAGFLELLDDEDLDEETRRGFLATTREQVERMATLAAHLLDLSRLDAGRLRVEREDVDLADAARVVVEELAPLAAASGHVLELEAGEQVFATADEERVIQVLRALAGNALVHTRPGTRVVVRACRRPGGAVIEVEDDGDGIPAEHLGGIFERFYRVEGTRASGSGLGLAIARELAAVMDGELAVTSRPGHTVFALTLPPSAAEAGAPRDAVAVST